MLSGHWFSISIHDNLGKSPDQVYDRLLNQWATMGVIGALMLSFAFGTFTNPGENPDGIEYGGIDAIECIGILNFWTLSLFLVSLCSSVLLAMALMTLPSSLSVDFTSEFRHIITLPELTTVSGLYIYTTDILLYGILEYGTKFNVIGTIAILLSITMLLSYWSGLVLGLDRKGGLWEKAKEKLSSAKE